MTKTPNFTPKLDVLPPPQRNIWEKLGSVPREFVLYGGTALALHFGHRQSDDFDFFGTREFDPGLLYRQLPLLTGAQIIQQVSSTLSVMLDVGGPVKISFFGLPDFRRIEDPLVADNGVQIAGLLDLAGTKVAVVQQRAEAKDYLDVAALLRHGTDLTAALKAAGQIYGAGFNPQISLKALSYFGDGDLERLTEEVKKELARAVAGVDLGQWGKPER